jgi:tetratricopeptide (TPR) repeat protein
LQQKWQQQSGGMATSVLVGDAAFFRGAACARTLPERSLKDFQALLHQRRWIEGERRCGGGRIVFLGDALARLGQLQAALAAYDMAADVAPAAKGRAAVLRVYQAWREKRPAKALIEAADRAAAETGDDSWPALFASLALLVAGRVEEALPRLERACQGNLPPEIVGAVHWLARLAAGPFDATDEELAALGLPPTVEAALGVLCDTGARARQRLCRLIEAAGQAWADVCPSEPAALARRVAAGLCDNLEWDEALQFVTLVERCGQAWARELSVLVKLRHILVQAVAGDMEQADPALRDLESSLSGAQTHPAAETTKD